MLSTNTTDLFDQLANQRVIVLDGSIDPLTSAQEEALCAYIEQGGGLVCLGKAVEVYHEYELLGNVLGHVRGIYTPQTEIIAHVVSVDSFFTRRADPTFAVFESCYLLEKLPADAQAQWQTTWHYAPYTVAYTRTYGQGRIFCTTLGSTPETKEHPTFQQMLTRAHRYATGAPLEEQPVRIAMIGYGSIGFEHGTAIQITPGLDYALVCDLNEPRLAQARKAFPGIRTCTDITEIEQDPTIDLVIVSTPPNPHAAITMRMLRSG
jgi:type 1 glutamine amidotransferase